MDKDTLRVRYYDGKRVHLAWGTQSDVSVERSRQRSGEYSPVNTLSQSTQYIDTLPSTRNSRDKFFYRVQLLDENDNVTKTLGPEAPTSPQDTRALYVRQQADRHLRRIGEKSHLFEEADGERCPDCWDDVRQVRERSNCDTCDGNGYVSGWSAPLELHISYGTGEAEPKQTQGGKVSTLQLQCWTGAVPEIDVGDHIVRDRDREVFRVVKRQPTKKGPHDIRQNVILKMVERGSKARSVADELSP
jgi:hypothetical protein